MTCPNCQSNDWKSAKFMHQTNTVIVDTAQRGGTFGVGASTSGIGAGYARTTSDTTGTHSSMFTKSIEPPVVPPHPGQEDTPTNPVVAPMFAWILGPMLVYGIYKDFGGLFGVIGAILLYSFRKQWLNICNNSFTWMDKNKNNRFKRDIQAHEEGIAAYKKWENTRVCQRCGHIYTN